MMNLCLIINTLTIKSSSKQEDKDHLKIKSLLAFKSKEVHPKCFLKMTSHLKTQISLT